MINLTSQLTEADLAVIKRIYDASFPVEERRPWETIIKPAKAGCPTLYAILSDGHIVGMATVWTFGRFAYIEHLALDGSVRNRGLGSEALSAIIDTVSPLPVVVEVEVPTDNDPMTRRRVNFYARHGFQVIDPYYVQPPYADGLPEVELYLMANAPVSPVETTYTLHTEVYGKY